ncbi:glutathione S-transferase family protein [Altererythrobacter soli]|uniref:Glutathione S-transferase family protein n=1 Tax=Croceibacterium soli TaxID=1739690 RepID=A0A6I4UQR2_9SPHN|nr:glutathione S-transferase family protein [Croceibacterium soli]MXP41121.1 glutathione S-transferase family protein [Croceibacterium soli]
MLELYHFGPVANSLTPLLALLEKDLPFQNRFLNSRAWEHHSPEFQRLSPEGMVPILVHDGKVVRESTVINEYLEDVFPSTPLRPADPWLRSEMRVWTKFVDEYFCPALTVLGAQGATGFASQVDKQEMTERLSRMPNEEVRRKWEAVSSQGFSEEQLADARRRVEICVDRMERQLADGRQWLVGSEYSLADIKWYSMVPALPRIVPQMCNQQASPSVCAWLQRMEQRRAVKALASFRAPSPNTRPAS